MHACFVTTGESDLDGQVKLPTHPYGGSACLVRCGRGIGRCTSVMITALSGFD